MKPRNEPRRPSLATVVGSSLAVVAAGSLLAFTTLAEQAGLQGLATGGIQPARPGRATGGASAITIPAATAPQGDPSDDLTELVRETLARDDVARSEPAPAISFARAPRREPQPRPEPDHIESPARVAVADAAAPEDQAETAEWDGPPYGHAYGHYKNGRDKPKAPKKKGAPESRSGTQPVYARTAAEEPPKGPKPPKMKKVQKGPAKAKANGHTKHAHAKGKGKAKGKGHAKHGG